MHCSPNLPPPASWVEIHLHTGDRVRIGAVPVFVYAGGVIEVTPSVAVVPLMPGEVEGPEGKLVLTIRPRRFLLLDGSLIRARRPVSLRIMSRFPMVLGNNYVVYDKAMKPLAHIAYLLQQAFAGPRAERLHCWDQARREALALPGEVARIVQRAEENGELLPAILALTLLLRAESVGA